MRRAIALPSPYAVMACFNAEKRKIKNHFGDRREVGNVVLKRIPKRGMRNQLDVT